MIQITNLVKKYGNKTALQGIDLTVKEGEIMGLLGPNGAGKSTTMNIMTGYLSATSGEVKINGHDILTEPIETKKSIGYLPEIPPLYMDMKVKEYLNFVAQLKKLKKAERKKQVEQVMELVEVKEYENRLIKYLSKGYKQRVGLAQALLGEPKLLILDEPTVGLDPNQIIRMRKLIKDLAKDHTIILSSHILSEISAICDSVVIIDQGKVIARGTAEELEEQFTNKEVIWLTVKGEQEKVKSAVKECKCFVSYDMEELEEEQWRIRAEMKSEEDMRDQLFFYFAEKKIPVLNMEQETKSLEDVFLQLTGKESEEAK
ncbi:MAG: ABC transporter ATP-binding protein [Anaerostipes sp.]|uniref:ABC transporter ATP-binding protein n=1 Tax=Anaerostipes sp. 992a TaxID=1261637 RepID=UPI000952F03A|nr:ABC transporter ATP-binding protein [Anaerostipes sp. 992a]MCI5951775.1 ABC transporter ATP-binding protein [Anaerostipes sp.]MDD5969213.1 ABC transporter ATP-binding protein [Anaerostipes sp.]OLR63778.1 ABC transporter [Anaerostipes sp. 992a]